MAQGATKPVAQVAEGGGAEVTIELSGQQAVAVSAALPQRPLLTELESFLATSGDAWEFDAWRWVGRGTIGRKGRGRVEIGVVRVGR